jgi:hypothetical protein
LQHDPKLVKELWINHLLPAEKMNTIKYTSGYRVLPADLENFKENINGFVRSQMAEANLTHYELR